MKYDYKTTEKWLKTSYKSSKQANSKKYTRLIVDQQSKNRRILIQNSRLADFTVFFHMGKSRSCFYHRIGAWCSKLIMMPKKHFLYKQNGSNNREKNHYTHTLRAQTNTIWGMRGLVAYYSSNNKKNTAQCRTQHCVYCICIPYRVRTKSTWLE